MINILVPMAGKSQHFQEQEFPFPMPLIEIGSKTMIEHVIENLSTVSDHVQFIFVINSNDCKKFYLDNTLKILTNGKCQIVQLDKETRGSACSALMAIDYVGNDTPLLIANSDQIFEDSISNLIAKFHSADADAGVVIFDSVHPRWSYIRLDEKNEVVETAEKRPISRHAIAGLYYFRKGLDFVEGAMRMIQKDESVNGNYFVSPILNQMILSGKTILTKKIQNERYFTFYTPSKIKEYEDHIKRT